MEGHAETPQAPPLMRLVTTRLESGPVGRVEGAFKETRCIDVLQRHAECRGEGHVPRLDQVAVAQVRGIEAQFARRVIDDALGHVDGFRATRASVGVDGRRMGHHGTHPDMGRLEAVGTEGPGME